MTRLRFLLKFEAVSDGYMYPCGNRFSTNRGKIRCTGRKACAESRSPSQRHGRRRMLPRLMLRRRENLATSIGSHRVIRIPVRILRPCGAYLVIRPSSADILINSVSECTRNRRKKDTKAASPNSLSSLIWRVIPRSESANVKYRGRQEMSWAFFRPRSAALIHGVIQFVGRWRSIAAFVRRPRYNPNALPGRNNPPRIVIESAEIGYGSLLEKWKPFR